MSLMGAHVRKPDNKEKYGILIVWGMVVMVGLVALMLCGTIAVYGNIWVGISTAVLTVLAMIRLITYTRDLIKATA